MQCLSDNELPCANSLTADWFMICGVVSDVPVLFILARGSQVDAAYRRGLHGVTYCKVTPVWKQGIQLASWTAAAVNTYTTLDARQTVAWNAGRDRKYNVQLVFQRVSDHVICPHTSGSEPVHRKFIMYRWHIAPAVGRQYVICTW